MSVVVVAKDMVIASVEVTVAWLVANESYMGKADRSYLSSRSFFSLCRVLTRSAIEQPDIIQEQKNVAAR